MIKYCIPKNAILYYGENVQRKMCFSYQYETTCAFGLREKYNYRYQRIVKKVSSCHCLKFSENFKNMKQRPWKFWMVSPLMMMAFNGKLHGQTFPYLALQDRTRTRMCLGNLTSSIATCYLHHNISYFIIIREGHGLKLGVDEVSINSHFERSPTAY